MQVIDIMTTPVRTVRPTTPVMAALRMLADHRLSGLPVVDDAGALVGIVTEKDLLRQAIDPPLSGSATRHLRDTAPAQVAQVMTPGPHTMRPDADVADAARLFSIMSWKSLPVVRDGELVGVISRSDVVRALSRHDAAVQRDLERLCANAGHVDWRVRVTEGVAEVRGPRSPEELREATRLARSVVGVRRVHHVADDAGPDAAPDTVASGPADAR
jgi:CBS domain-containing protein